MRFVNGNATRSCHSTKPTSKRERHTIVSLSVWRIESPKQKRKQNWQAKQAARSQRNERNREEQRRNDDVVVCLSSCGQKLRFVFIFFVWLETETETWLKARYEYFSRCEQLVRVGRVLKLSSPFEQNKKQKEKEKQTRKKEQKRATANCNQAEPPAAAHEGS